MDPRSPYPALLAPGASARPTLLAPGASAKTPVYCPPTELPRLDDHVAPVEDEERIEILDGQRISAMAGASPEHAGPQADLAAVLRFAAAPGYRALVELLTRADTQLAPPDLDPAGPLPHTLQDLVTDACILREGTDPRTGDRFLEELAFEVANEQTLSNLKKKAARLSEKGVRRIFGLLVKKRQVLEWRPDRHDFDPVIGEIRDPALRLPLTVRALLDGAEADDLVARALIHKENHVIAELRRSAVAEGRKDGKVEEARATVLRILLARGFDVSASVRDQVQGCADLSLLQSWTIRAALEQRLADVFRTPQ